MATLDDLTNIDGAIAADVQGLITAIQAIPAGTLSASDQAKVDAAVTSLTTTDTAVKAETAVETPPVVPPTA